VRVWSGHLEDPRIGTVRVWATDLGIRRIEFDAGPDGLEADEQLSSGPAPAHLAATLAELAEYFTGKRREFAVLLDLSATTDFQRRVYERLLQIPYGHVSTYGEVARDIGADASAARAVGGAVGANPIAIVIPCHRVVASDGRLVGFGGGIQRKAALLRLEGIDVDGVKASSRVHPEIIRLSL
jgi:methylated-DNA-[protein]-cysteine S-methyltransferase